MTRSPSWRARWRGCSPRSTAPARNTEAMLDRQREFVADASHELRTPLTSVLANLELLTEELEGEQAETAEAALRSTRRMRRLVGDLLLLARADARRVQPHRPTDVAEVLIEAAAELGPMAERHELSIAAEPVGRRRRARRASPAGAQPAGERGPSHAAGHPRQRQYRPRRRRGGDHRRGRRARDLRRARAPGVRALRARRARRRARIGSGPGHRPGGGRVPRRHGGAGASRGRHRHPLRDPDPGRRRRDPGPGEPALPIRLRRRPAAPSGAGATGRRRTRRDRRGAAPGAGRSPGSPPARRGRSSARPPRGYRPRARRPAR